MESGENTIDLYPIYNSIERRGVEDKFLTSSELIVQTDLFMEKFQNMINESNIPDTIFFLDKSARPVAYMFKRLFPNYYPDIKIPEIRFINIGGSGSNLYDRDSRPIKGNPEIVKQTYGKNININEKILIVDEFTLSGKALESATEVLSGAFPEATINSIVAYNKLPNWYQNEEYLGVNEYTKYNYEKIAIDQLNLELNTNYKDKLEMINDSTMSNIIFTRFWEIYSGIESTIPYVKKGRHVYTKNSVNVNVFREARMELNEICEEIIKQKKDSKTSVQ